MPDVRYKFPADIKRELRRTRGFGWRPRSRVRLANSEPVVRSRPRLCDVRAGAGTSDPMTASRRYYSRFSTIRSQAWPPVESGSRTASLPDLHSAGIVAREDTSPDQCAGWERIDRSAPSFPTARWSFRWPERPAFSNGPGFTCRCGVLARL